MSLLIHGAKPREHNAFVSTSPRQIISTSFPSPPGRISRKVSKVDTVFNTKCGEWSSVVWVDLWEVALRPTIASTLVQMVGRVLLTCLPWILVMFPSTSATCWAEYTQAQSKRHNWRPFNMTEKYWFALGVNLIFNSTGLSSSAPLLHPAFYGFTAYLPSSRADIEAIQE